MAAEKPNNEETQQTPPPKRRKQTTLLTPESVQDGANQEDIAVSTFDLELFVKHNNWVGNVKAYNWKPRTSAFFDLVNAQGTVITVLLFGKVTTARVGTYGDFNEIYHQSLIQPGIRNLVWKLGPPPGFADAFYKQYESLQKIENALDSELQPNQRSAKTASDIELKRKIAKKVDSTTPIVPHDEDKDFWKK
jgi:hypothetical protein